MSMLVAFISPLLKKNRYNGVMEEFFGHLEQLPNETDRSNGKRPDDDESIHSLAALGVRQTISEINWTDEKDNDQSFLPVCFQSLICIYHRYR